MTQPNILLRMVAVRLGVLVVILYSARALVPDQSHMPRNDQPRPVAPTAAVGLCGPLQPAVEHDGETDALLRDMLLHD